MSAEPARSPAPRSEYLATLLLVGVWSFAMLYFEILESKLLQFFRVYGHPLFIVALAMLGMGVGGLFVYARRGYHENMLRASLLLSGPLLIVAMVAPGLVANPFLAAFCLAAVFFCYSLVLGVSFARFDSYAVYFCNLIGSGAGIASVYFVLPRVGGETSVLILAAVLALAAALYPPLPKPGKELLMRVSPFLVCMAVLSFGLLTGSIDSLRLPVSRAIPSRSPLEIAGKAIRLKDAKLLASRTNLVARVDVIETPGHPVRELFFPEGTASVVNPLLRKEADLSYNSDTQLYANNTFFSSVTDSGKLYTESLPYILLREPSVLVIGPGGGVDLARAKYAGAKRIVAAEINSTVVQLMTGPLRARSGGVYDGVELFQMDGRSYLQSSSDRFDLINLVFVDLYIPFYNSNVFMENYLYTLEAFDGYLGHLTPDGILSLTKMIGSLNSPTELLRIFATLLEAMKRAGIPDPNRNLAVIGFGDANKGHYAGIIMAKRSPFTTAEIATIKSFLQPPLFPLFIPGETAAANPFQDLARIEDPNTFYRQFPLWISPTTDNRPFFYLFDKKLAMHKGMARNFALMLVVIFFLPAAVLVARRKAELGKAGPALAVYFALIGIGYMLIQTVLVQRFNLYLGGALYSLCLVVGALLVFAGLGSMVASRLPARLQSLVILILPLVLIAYLAPMPFLAHTAGFSLGRRAGVSLALLFPLSFLIGFPFPLGLRLAREKVAAGSAPLFYGLNSVFCTLAVVESLYYSARFGLRPLYFASAAAYLGAALILLVLLRKK